MTNFITVTDETGTTTVAHEALGISVVHVDLAGDKALLDFIPGYFDAAEVTEALLQEVLDSHLAS